MENAGGRRKYGRKTTVLKHFRAGKVGQGGEGLP
jgi:hypothetical protein